MKIRPLLKSYSWYNEIMEQISGSTLSLSNEFIVDNYFKLTLALYVQQRLIITQTYHLERAGLRVKLSDVSDVATPEDIRYVRQDNMQSQINDNKEESKLTESIMYRRLIKFEAESSNEYNNLLNKLDTLIQSFNDFRVYVEKEK